MDSALKFARGLVATGIAATLFAAPVASAGEDQPRAAGRAGSGAPAVLPLPQAIALAEVYAGGKVVAIEGRGYSATQADIADLWQVRIVRPDGSASRLVIDGRTGELLRGNGAKTHDEHHASRSAN